MKSFISRHLEPESPFRLLLERQGWQVHGLSLVRLTPLPLPELPAADWIFFASGHAVRFFFDQLQGRALPATKWAAIGPATAALLAGFTGRVDFAGTGDPAGTAEAFRSCALQQSVLFPAARNSRQSIPDLLGLSIRAQLLEVYDNIPLPDPPRRDDDVLVFTSPLNARSYFSRHLLQPNQRLVAIGPTTASALHQLGQARVVVAPEPTESGLAQTVLDLTS